MMKHLRHVAGLVAVASLALGASATIRAAEDKPLDLPLTVTERAGVGRIYNHVNSGFPLPEGKIRNVSELALLAFNEDEEKWEPIEATFAARALWPKDKSVRWATVHFFCSPPPDGKLTFRVGQAKSAGFAYPIKTQGNRDRTTIDTGTIRFSIDRRNFSLIDELSYDPKGKAEYKQLLVTRGGSRLNLVASSGAYKVDRKKAVGDVLSPPFETEIRADPLVIEENSPGRVVIKVTGTFYNGITPILDFLARVYALSGSSTIRISLTVFNRHGQRWEDFVGIHELSFAVAASLGKGRLDYTFSQSRGEDLEGVVTGDETAWLLQPASGTYLFGGTAAGTGRARDLSTRRLGWVNLRGKDAGMSAGIRNFWQMHPKGLSVSGNGEVAIHLVPRREEAIEVEATPFSTPLRRIDLLCGAARTHEFAISFTPPDDTSGGQVMTVVDPLIAEPPTWWFCQGTRAEGLLWDTHTEPMAENHRPLVKQFNDHLANQIAAIAELRNGQRMGAEAYGWLNYGDFPAEALRGAIVDWLNTKWLGHGGDFARAAMVQYWRSGDPTAWELARSAGQHLADMGLAHYYPGRSEGAGVQRASPNFGHFRRVWSGAPFGVEPDMDSYASRSLYDLYHMTGERTYLDAAELATAYCLTHTGSSLPASAARAAALFEGWRQTHDKKFLQADQTWLSDMVLARKANQKWDNHWTYGPAAGELMRLYRATGEQHWADGVVRAADSLVNSFASPGTAGMHVRSGSVLNCFGYAYEITKKPEYLTRGLEMMKLSTQQAAGDTFEFTVNYRLAPYFLHYLTQAHIDGSDKEGLPGSPDEPAEPKEKPKPKSPGEKAADEATRDLWKEFEKEHRGGSKK